MTKRAHIRWLPLRWAARAAERLAWLGGALVGGILLFYLFSHWIFASKIRHYLEEKTQTAVFLEEVRWSSPLRVQLRHLVLAEDAQKPRETLILHVERAECVLSLGEILRLRFQPRVVSVENAAVEVRYDAAAGKWNLSRFLPTGKKEAAAGPMPEVIVKSARLRFLQVEEGKQQTLVSTDLQGHLRPAADGYEVHLEAADGTFAGSRLEGLWKPQDSRGHLELAGRIQMPQTSVYGNRWNLEEMELSAAYDKERLSIERFSCGLGEGCVFIQGEISGPAGQKNLDVRLQLENLYLSPVSRPNAIVYSEPVLKMMTGGLEHFLRRYRPEGTADASLQIQGSLADLAASQIKGGIICRDIAILDREFPYRLEGIRGRIELTGRDLFLRDLQAHNGASEFTIVGQIKNFGPQGQIHLRVTSSRVLLTEEIKQALPEPLQQKWFEFAPAGQCGFDYQFVQEKDAKPTHRAVIHLQGVHCLYDRYPYPLTNLTGTMVMEPNAVLLQDIRARPKEGQEIRIEGTIRGLESLSQVCDLRITAHRLSIDSTLRNTFRSPIRRILSEFEVDGRLDLDVQVKGVMKEDEPPLPAFSFQVEASRFLWKRFPLELKGVQIRGSAGDGKMEIQGAGLLPDGGGGQLVGHFWDSGKDPNQPAIRIAVAAEEMGIGPAFWQAMEQAGLCRGMLSLLRVEGIAKTAGSFCYNCPDNKPPMQTQPAATLQTQLTVYLKEGFLYEAPGGWRSGPAAGTLLIENRQLRLQDWKIRDVSLGEEWIEKLTPRWKAIAALKPSLKADVTVDLLEWNPDLLGPPQKLEGRVEIHQGGSEHLSVSGACGVLEGKLAWPAAQGLPSGGGRFSLDSLEVMGRSLSSLEGNWTADPNSGVVNIRDIHGFCGGGRVLANLLLTMSEPFLQYEVEAMFEEIPIAWLLGSEAQGRLRGAVDMRGKVDSPDDREGHITVEAEEMKIGRETLFGKLLMMMQLRQADDVLFTDLFVDANLKGQLVQCERVLLAGKNDVYQGQGHLNLGNGKIQMALTAFGRRKGEKATLLTGLAENLGAALARVEISGTLSQPVITQIPLPLLPRPF